MSSYVILQIPEEVLPRTQGFVGKAPTVRSRSVLIDSTIRASAKTATVRGILVDDSTTAEVE